MLDNHNLGFEKNTPPNQIEGVLRAYLTQVYNAMNYADVPLLPVVRAEMAATKPVNSPPEVAQTPIRPTATEMLAQVATAQPKQPEVSSDENLFAEPTDSENLATQQRRAIDAIHAEIEAERLNQGDFDRAA